MKKKILLLSFVFGLSNNLFAYNNEEAKPITKYVVKKQMKEEKIYTGCIQRLEIYGLLLHLNNQLKNISYVIINNNKWYNKLHSLSTYTLGDFTKMLIFLNKIAKIEKVLLNNNISNGIPYEKNQTFVELAYKINTLSSEIRKLLKTSPDNLKNVYLFLSKIQKLIKYHNLLMKELYTKNDPIYKAIYLTTYPEAKHYKIIKKYTLYYLYNYLDKVYNKNLNQFVKDIKKDSYKFLRYFGKSIEYVNQIDLKEKEL